MSFGKSESNQQSQPLSPDQVGNYFLKLDQLTGGKPGTAAAPGTPGRLLTFAQQGTQPTEYQALTPDQLRALGGAGATRELDAQRARRQAVEQIAADPSLSAFQRQRSQQLTNQDYQDRLDAIAKETEAALTGVAQTEAARKYQAGVNNANLTREDLIALANIFFGGKGQTSQGSSNAFNVGYTPPK